MNKDWIDMIEPFEYRGHILKARLRSGNVSASGPAIASNAMWLLSIDNVEQGPGIAGAYDDTEGEIKEQLCRVADGILDACSREKGVGR